VVNSGIEYITIHGFMGNEKKELMDMDSSKAHHHQKQTILGSLWNKNTYRTGDGLGSL